MDLIHQSEMHTILDEDKFDNLVHNYCEESFVDGTVQDLFLDKMSKEERTTLSALVGLSFSDCKGKDTSNLFPDNHIMTENDILEYIIKSTCYSEHEIIQCDISDETYEEFQNKFNNVIIQSKQLSTKHKNCNTGQSLLFK